jgi:lipopolysaccharide/colanic/teichoic acid biosynthesis glycosyltransferase
MIGITDLQYLSQQEVRLEQAPSSANGSHPPEQDDPLRLKLNKTLAGIALFLLAPLLVAIAVAIKLTSKGPIIYTQPRVGLDRRSDDETSPKHHRVQDLGGKPFRIYKFRTMTVDAEKNSGAVWAQKNDPRVTWLGGLLRKSRLDELPQLFNVLSGEMNMVGPRPERPAIFADLRDKVPTYQHRQRTRPGITGLAQINQQYDRNLDDVRRKVAYDLEYIEKQSILEDLRIMLKTLPVVFFRRGGW